MKTAIQELIEKFQEYNKPKIKGLVRINMSLDNVIEFCEEALEKEKEQIIGSYMIAAINNTDKEKWYRLDKEYFEICANEYFKKHFNQTYNQQ